MHPYGRCMFLTRTFVLNFTLLLAESLEVLLLKQLLKAPSCFCFSLLFVVASWSGVVLVVVLVQSVFKASGRDAALMLWHPVCVGGRLCRSLGMEFWG